MSKHHVTITINGKAHEADVESRLLLVHFLRENLNMTGTHIGCDTTSCGACTVQLKGKPVKSCTVLAVQADGMEVKTVEGLAANGKLPILTLRPAAFACSSDCPTQAISGAV